MNYTLTAVKRATRGFKTRELEGLVPGVVYGAKTDSMSLSFNYAELLKVYKAAGESTLVDLVVDAKPAGKVIIQDVQHDPVKDFLIHVDLKRIDMNKEMHAPVELKFVGEAPVIKEQGGTIVTTVHTVTVKCLPKDLVSHLDISLSLLKTYDDFIKVKDLKLPAGITIVSPRADDLIVKAARALSEAEIKKMEEEAAAMDVSKIESSKPKKEEETVAGAEGAAPVAAVGVPAAKPGDDKTAKTAPAAKKEEKK